MVELTICIPCAPYHADIVKRAIASCAAQVYPDGKTLQVYYGIQMDTDSKGAGWARNQMIKKVNTPYITFLDADDWLEPLYAFKMLDAIHRSELANRYVYCGWIEDFPETNMFEARSENVEAPAKAWCGQVERDNHLVTSVYPTQWVQMISGFDETLPGLEDVDFAFKMRSSGHCGDRVNEFLIHYTDHGKRSDDFRQRTDRNVIVQEIRNRYQGGALMACCDDRPTMKAPIGDRQTGDILAMWMPPPVMSGYIGRATGRRYFSAGYGAQIWIHPEDAAQDAQRFRVIPIPPPRPPVEVTRQTISTPAEVAQVIQQQQIHQGSDVYLPQNDLPGKKGKIDVNELRKLAGYK